MIYAIFREFSNNIWDAMGRNDIHSFGRIRNADCLILIELTQIIVKLQWSVQPRCHLFFVSLQ